MNAALSRHFGQPGRAKGRRGALAITLVAAIAAVLLAALAIVSTVRPPDRELIQARNIILEKAGDLKAARSKAMRSLAANGPDVSSLVLLGVIADREGKKADAFRLMTAAEHMSRRDKANQVWLFDYRLRSGDYGRAIENADAVLRLEPQLGDQIYPVMIAAAADPKAAEAISRRLDYRPSWRPAFVLALAAKAEPGQTFAILSDLKRDEARATDEEVSAYLQRLIGLKRYDEALLGWILFTPANKLTTYGGVFDGEFDGVSGPQPFNWTISSGAGATVDFAPAPGRAGNAALHVSYDGFSRRQLISQLLVLPPGQYNLKGQAMVETPEWRDRLQLTLTCADTGQSLLQAAAPGERTWGGFSIAFVVPPDCKGQQLEFKPNPGDRQIAFEAWFDHITVDRTGRLMESSSVAPHREKHRVAPDERRESLDQPVTPFAIATYALIVIALSFGGASRQNAIPLLIAELAAAALLPFAVWRASQMGGRGLRGGVFLLAMMGLVIVIQFTPLPPSIWTALPGRDLAAGAYQAAGVPLPWATLSLTPAFSLRSALSVTVAATLFLAVATLSARERWLGVGVILAVTALSLVLGVFQIVGGTDSPAYLYARTNEGSLVGFFSNRNHQASLLLCGLPLAATLVTFQERQRFNPKLRAALAGGALLLFLLALVAVKSRAGILLLAPALLGAAIIFLRSGGAFRHRRAVIVIGAIILVAGVAITQFGLSAVMDRFSADIAKDLRWAAAPRVWEAAQTYFPLGSGLGSFDLVYRSVEPLDTVTYQYLNHAHDDALELLLETGLPGLAVLAGFIVWFLLSAWRAWRSTGSNGSLSQAATIVIVLLIAHSFVDYPLRTVALMSLFAFACALLVNGGPCIPLGQTSQMIGLTVRRAGWVTLGVAGGQGLVLIATLWLARLYSPAQFGALAVLMTMGNIGAAVACLRYDLALPAAQDEDVQGLLRSAIAAAVAFGALATLACLFIAPMISNPSAATLAKHPFLVGACFTLPGLFQAAGGWLLRKSAFKSVGALRLSQGLIFPAVASIGALGLLAAYVASFGAGLVAVAAAFRRPVQASRSWRAVARSHWRMPVLSLPGATLDVVGYSLLIWVVVNFYGSTGGGVYSQTQRLVGAPMMLLSMSVGQVLLRQTAELSADPKAVRRLLLQILAIMGSLAAAGVVALVLIGEPLFHLLLGPGWNIDRQMIVATAIAVGVRACIAPLSLNLITQRRFGVALSWQALYFCSAAVLFPFAASRLELPRFLVFYAAHEIVLYGLYLILILRTRAR